MTELDSLRRRVLELEHEVADARRALRAFAEGQVDAVAREAGTTPVLLKHAQDRLLRSERMMRSLFEGASDAFILSDQAGLVVDANPAAAQLFALPVIELKGRDVSELVGQPASGVSWRQQIRQAPRGAVDIRAGAFARHAEYNATVDVLPGVDLAVLRDVTQQIEVQKTVAAATAAVAASEERYRRIVETTSEGVYTTNLAGEITFTNARFAEMLGVRREDMIGRSLVQFVAHDVSQAPTAEQPFRHANGRVVWARISRTSLKDGHGHVEGDLALVSDITEQRQGEETRRRLAAIVSSSEDAIVSVNAQGQITDWNRGAEKLYGYAAEEILGKPLAILFPDGAGDDVKVTMAKALRGENQGPFETTRRRKDGSLVEVSLTVSCLEDGSGKVTGVSKIARDLTDRRRQEALLRRTEEQLRQAQKMEAVGNLAGGIAHDFNNILSVILSYASLALDELPADSVAREDLQQVTEAAQRAAALTRQLLAFSRQQILSPRVLDLNAIFTALTNILSRLLGEHIAIALHLAPELGPIYADPTQMEQMIMNLVINARDAMPDGGTLTLATSNVILDAAAATHHHDLSPGAYVVVTVQDTGVGMDAEVRERIFEPFFTTKEPGKGTGLGLSTVFGIVKQSGGHITVQSTLAQGTTFTIYLPHTQRPRAVIAAHGRPGRTLKGHETVLVVEDDPAVRSGMLEILRRHHYNVLEAQDGVDALAVCERAGQKIHLLVTDIVMPRMNGRVLNQRLKALYPEMKALFVSGYTETTVINEVLTEDGVAYLPKPVTPEELARKVRDVLERPAPQR